MNTQQTEKRGRRTLKNLLTLVFSGLAIIPLLLAGLLVGYYTYTFQKEQVFRHEDLICRNMAANLESFFHRLEYNLQTISQFKNFNTLTASEQEGIFTELLTEQRVFSDIALLDPRGKILRFVSNSGAKQSDMAKKCMLSILEAHNQAMKTRTLQYGSVRFEEETGEPFIHIALPLQDLRTGEIAGLIVADVRIKSIWSNLVFIQLNQEEGIFVLDSRNRVIGHRNPSIVLRETYYEPPDSSAIIRGLSGRTSLVSSIRVDFSNLHLRVVKEIPAISAFEPLVNTIEILIIIMIATMLVALGLVIFSGRLIIDPIVALTDTARSIKKGDFSARATVSEQFETGELAIAFNAMTNRLQRTLLELENEVTERKAQQQVLAKSERYNRMLFEETPLGLALSRMDGSLMDINQAYAGIIGRTIAETRSLRYWDITPEKYRSREEEQLEILQATGRYGPYEKEYIHKEGHLVPVVLTGLLIEQDEEPFIWSVVEDITIRKKTEQKLQLAGKAMESSLEGIVITDADEKIAEINSAYCTISGYSRDEIIGRTPRHMQSGYHTPEFYREMWESINNEGEWQGEIWDRRKDGEVFAKWLSISSLKDSDQKITHYVGVFSDITLIKQTEEELRQLAHYDPLTGLANRTLFTTLLEKAIVSAVRQQDVFAVIFLDLDRFKQVNDTLGHQAGDELLILVARRLEQCVRNADTVARLGGDEFTLILNEYSGEFNPEIICQRVLESLEQPIVIEEQPVFISASLGIAVYPRDGMTIQELTKNADTAMYQAKEKGKNRYQFYDESMNARAMERLETENKLRRAIEKGHLFLYYQPKLDIQQGRVSGCEALIRWIDPEEGIIPPDLFIPVAEETDLIRIIGRFVTREACRQARIWSDTTPELLPVSINLSANEFSDVNLLAEIESVLEETGLDPGHLEIELTETTVMDRSDEKNMAILNQIQALGVKLSIDDFGTGYSSLSYLKNLPFNAIKIDRSFIRDITRDRSGEAIIRAILSMAHNLNLEVIAEGVETREQLEFLRALKGEKIQGYFYSKPLPPLEVEKKLVSKESRAILEWLAATSASSELIERLDLKDQSPGHFCGHNVNEEGKDFL